MNFSLGLGLARPLRPATTPPVIPPIPAFAFELLTETGSPVITAVPNLRVSLDGGTVWQSLAAAGLTVARDGSDRLRIAGFASNAARDAALFHYEQRLPGEPNNAASTVNALFARRIGDAGPVNPALPGMAIAATPPLSPIGVAR